MKTPTEVDLLMVSDVRAALTRARALLRAMHPDAVRHRKSLITRVAAIRTEVAVEQTRLCRRLKRRGVNVEHITQRHQRHV